MYNYGVLPDLEASAVELKYADSCASMLIILPDKKNGLEKLEKNLQNYDIKNILKQMTEESVEVTLPIFQIETKIELNSILNKVNITTFNFNIIDNW